MPAARPLLLLLTLVAACGDEPVSPDGGAPTDSAVVFRDGDVVTPTAPAAPAAPAPTTPMRWDCPDGWRSVALEAGAVECSPWPDGTEAPSACPVGEAHFPGTGACAPVGATCPADGWPASLPSGRTVHYVRAGAAGGGTGVRTAPYRRIADAVAVASSGDVIAVGVGTYDEVVFVEDGIALFGACPAETIVTNSTAEDYPVILMAGAGAALAEVHDVSIRDAIHSGIFVDVGTSALIEGVEVASVSDSGVIVLTADATLRRVSIRDVAPRTSDGAYGFCIVVEVGSTATIDQLSGSECHTGGVVVSASTATVTNTVIANTRRNPTEMNNGTAFFATAGADATFRRIAVVGSDGPAVGALAATSTFEDVWIDRAHGVEVGAVVALAGGYVTVRRGRIANVPGISLAALNGTVRAEDVVVHYPDEEVAGTAVGVRLEGVMELDRVEMRDATSVTMLADGTGSTLRARDIVVDGNRTPQPRDGFGVLANGGASVDIERGTFRRTGLAALGVLDASSLRAQDIVVEDTRGNTDGTWGRAIHVQNGGSVTVDRLRADRVRGLAASGSEGELIVRDLHVVEVVPGPTMARGGASCTGGRLVLERARFDDVSFGIDVYDGAEVTVSDLWSHGAGIQAIGNCTLDAERVHIVEPIHFGLSAFEESVVHVEDIVILAPGDPGHGIVAMTRARVDIARFLIEDAPVCGVYVSDGGLLDLRDGDVRNCAIGACVQSVDFDATRLSDGVAYVDNDTNFDGVGGLPVPRPTSPIGGGEPIDPPPMP